ncbi:RNA 3'-terminal phosphate cyclase/enolpyruvate transferase [Microdochium trichocladiopsis]|uniref:RNA 3'-terminal phosphate cyclase/enolpyruvate transferase n=1 Tax=Microdochium trichocladiopsis TaxID=1682393 RepID=A0A9P8YDP0_9PEZI|nr:RNA 3'-terminal phosphate cyclase/enolpyruvate transferase [Microdochium trichocladiopsis]KAH7035051.1 RNA 3'-terminal phosphate cyclase/enolpyruvate transferase [Microdochium trichocladiopsis]
MSTQRPEFIKFTGHKSFALRLVLSTLTGRPIHISKIRSSSPTNPGLAPHEVSLLRLLEAVTNGSSMQISYTGTTITYQPGLITGAAPGFGATGDGDVVEHQLPATCTRGVTYFLLPLCLLAPFSKAHMNVRLTGPGVITAATDAGDLSVDSFRTGLLPMFDLFGIPTARIELRVLQRSCAGPRGVGGAGVVELRFASQVRLPKTLHLNRSPGRIKRIRGVAYATGVSASNNARMIHSAREVLNQLVSDIHIAAQYDQAPLTPTKDGGKRRMGIGFGLSLVAESSAVGVLYTADVVAPATGGVVPEDIGKKCAYQLLETISRGGCVTGTAAPIVLSLMAMGSEDVGRLRLGRETIGTEELIGLARDLKSFGMSSWGLRDVDEDDETDDIVISVKGTGVGNVGRKIA